MKKTELLLASIAYDLLLAACQANPIRDVQGGTMAPSPSLKNIVES